jgi:hypothetical protein
VRRRRSTSLFPESLQKRRTSAQIAARQFATAMHDAALFALRRGLRTTAPATVFPVHIRASFHGPEATADRVVRRHRIALRPAVEAATIPVAVVEVLAHNSVYRGAAGICRIAS